MGGWRMAYRMVLRLLAAFAASGLLCAASASAAVLISEVLPFGGSTGMDTGGPYVVLHNTDSVNAADVTGWTLGNKQPDTTVYTFPSLVIPPRSYAKVWFVAGADDLDALDGVVDLYAGASEPFEPDDEVGLFSGPIPGSPIVDYFGWHQDETFLGGAAYSVADLQDQWLENGNWNISLMPGGSSLARLPAARDTNTLADWGYLELGPRLAQSDSSNRNPLQIEPLHGTSLDSNEVAFSFQGPAWGEVLVLQADNNPEFNSPEVTQAYQTPGLHQLIVTLPTDIYYWRVLVKPQGQPFITRVAVWEVVVGTDDWLLAGVGLAGDIQHNVDLKRQHKDTSLVCIWDTHTSGEKGGRPHSQNPKGRPGCDPYRFPGQAWDAPHSDEASHVKTCGHCAFYASRACIATLNNHYGGDLTQDRASNEICQFDTPGHPEGALGHDRLCTPAELTIVLGWALGCVVTKTEYTAAPPTFTDFQNALANGPVVVSRGGHLVIVDGCQEKTANNKTVRRVHVKDPWPGNKSVWTDYSAWVPLNQKDMVLWTLPPGDKNGIHQEPEIDMDSDGDGLMDFDEGTPRPFCSDRSDPDTEDDELPDKKEVEAYTFHEERDHRGHDNDAAPRGFADRDGDLKRSECDCDSDNDGDFDGGEDIDSSGDGGMNKGRAKNETDMFASPKLIFAITDRPIYWLGETVLLLSGTLHETSTYPVDIKPGCPVLVKNDPLAQVATITTNKDGWAIWQPIYKCETPGIYEPIVDVLKDSKYSVPDNWDPLCCFVCLPPPPVPGTPDDPCAMRAASQGQPVSAAYVTVTGYPVSGQPGFYVQSTHNRCAIRVDYFGPLPSIGQLVSFEGTVNSSGYEPSVLASQVYTDVNSHNPPPTWTSNREIGGVSLPSTLPMQSPYGPNNTCMLVQTTGLVTDLQTGLGTMTISDGSVVNGLAVDVTVYLGAFAPQVAVGIGDQVVVTGVGSATPDGRRALVIRSPEDVSKALTFGE